jgi:hypothetical protein
MDGVMRVAIRVMLAAMFAGASLIGIASNARAADSPGSLTMQSPPGEYLGQGQNYSYSRPQDQVWANLGFNHSVVFGTVNGLNGDRWSLQFSAPDNQPLQDGQYLDAQGAPFQQAGHPGISVFSFATCQTITGQFDVLDIEYTNNTLTRADITFEEHCNGAAAALTGEFIYTPPPQLPALSFNVKIHHLGTVDSANNIVKASGTVTCNQYVWTMVSAQLTQGSGANASQAFAFTNVSCKPGTATAWTITANPFTPFKPGPATASAYASGEDGYTSTEATSPTANGTVLLIPHSH